MRDYSLSHLSDAVLLRDLNTLIGQERVTIANVLAHIAEVDARKLYAPAGYSSMFVYCVDELHFSEDAAAKRIQAARAARQYPVLFAALADGRLHMSAVRLLAPHLTPETLEELIVEASYRSKSEIEDMLAARYRRPLPPAKGGPSQYELAADPAEVEPLLMASPAAWFEHAPGHVENSPLQPEHAPQHVARARCATSSAPLCQLTVRQTTRDKLRFAQALLSHALPSGDLSDVLDRALDLLIKHTQTRRFGASSKRVARPRACASTRYIPTDVRHAVWERDQGMCTFVGTSGHRCNSNSFLELDHVDPRRKENTIEGLRLRCRTHNQLEAERVFGAEFMARKREESRVAAQERRARAEAEAVSRDQIRDVIAGLRNLGIRPPDAKRAAESTLTMDRPTLEDRMRAALSTITPRRQPQTRSIPPPASTNL